MRVSVRPLTLQVARKRLSPSLCRVPLVRTSVCSCCHSFMELSLSPSPVPGPVLSTRNTTWSLLSRDSHLTGTTLHPEIQAEWQVL